MMAPPRAGQCAPPLRGARLERAIRRLVGSGGEKGLEILWRMAQGYPMPIPGVESPPGAVDLSRVPSLELQKRCTQWLLERAFGRAPERVEIDTTPATRTRDLRGLSDHQLELVRQAVAALGPDDDPTPSEH